VFEGGDQRQDAQRLSNLASVLASKFCVRWMEEESPMAWPPEIRPASWTTVYRFVRSQEETGREIAIRHLERILEQDPLYRPAKFLLGYAKFRDGETERAEQLFSSLTQPFNEQRRLKLQDGMDKWTGEKSLHWLIQNSRIRHSLFQWIDPWIDGFSHITTLVHGSVLYRMTEAWARIDKRNVKPTKNRPFFDNTLDQLVFEIDPRCVVPPPVMRTQSRMSIRLRSGC
jgi:hypothetical protein